jgi:CHRD domain
MRQMLFLFVVVALVTAAVATAASAQRWPNSYTYGIGCSSCAVPQSTCSTCLPRTVAALPVPSCNTCAAAPLPTCNTCALAPLPTCTTCLPREVAALPVPSCNTCAAPAPVCSSCGQPVAVVPTAYATTSGCCAPAPTCGYCSVTGAQKWGADLINLTGQTVPSVCGTGCVTSSGRADFQETKEGDKLRYWVNVYDINCVTGADLRLIGPDNNPATAQTVAVLYNGGAREGISSGRLARGNITCLDLCGPLQGQPLSALLEAMTAGKVIAVVETAAHPGGELAGIPCCNVA